MKLLGAGRILIACLVLCQFTFTHSVLGQSNAVSRIAFGSCANQQKPCPIWGSIADYQPDLLLLLGDNIYADVVDGKLVPSTPQRIAEAYQQLSALPDFARLRTSTRILATWDDHDYGNNDAGIEWEHKDTAATLFHDFFGTPADSPLRQQQGIYNASIVGPPGQRLQVIMLDTRYFRTELEQSDVRMPGWRSKPYVPATGPLASMLGEAQWIWLEEQLRQPAELRIIGSSIQVVSNEHPFEKWGNFPDERQRLYDLIRRTQASGVVLLSGDRHLGDISVDNTAVGYPLYDVTASGLNQATIAWRPMEPNSHRVAGLPYGNHFGSIEIDWRSYDPLIKLQLRHEDGELAVQVRVPLSKLSAPTAEPPLPEGVANARQVLKLDEGTQTTVQFVVASGRELDQGDRLLLNSQADYRHPENLTIVVNNARAVATLETFLNKTIRVTSSVSMYNDRRQLQVMQPDQIAIIEN